MPVHSKLLSAVALVALVVSGNAKNTNLRSNQAAGTGPPGSADPTPTTTPVTVNIGSTEVDMACCGPFDGHLRRTYQQGERFQGKDDDGRICFGCGNSKTITVTPSAIGTTITCPPVVNKDNWLSDETHGDSKYTENVIKQTKGAPGSNSGCSDGKPDDYVRPTGRGNDCVWSDQYCTAGDQFGQCGIWVEDVVEKCGAWKVCGGVVCRDDYQAGGKKFCLARFGIGLGADSRMTAYKKMPVETRAVKWSGDTFGITVAGNKITAQRTDKGGSWGIDLKFECTASPTTVVPAPVVPAPVDTTDLIKNKHGICLVAKQRNKNGGKVKMWSCNENNKNQQFVYTPSTGQIKNKHGICLDASQRSKKGGKVHMWSCNENNKNQQWEIAVSSNQFDNCFKNLAGPRKIAACRAKKKKKKN